MSSFIVLSQLFHISASEHVVTGLLQQGVQCDWTISPHGHPQQPTFSLRQLPPSQLPSAFQRGAAVLGMQCLENSSSLSRELLHLDDDDKTRIEPDSWLAERITRSNLSETVWPNGLEWWGRGRRSPVQRSMNSICLICRKVVHLCQ